MKHLYKKSLFIFRRDLRLEDNTALNHALEQSETVIPCFIFDPQQVTQKNEYYSANAVQFMIESLQSLNKQLHERDGKLFLFYGKAEDVVKNIVADIKIEALFINQDYTPFSIKRDSALQKICTDNDIVFKSCADILLNTPTEIHKTDGSFYSVFTAFYNNAHKILVQKPHPATNGTFFTSHIKNSEPEKIYSDVLPNHNKNIFVHGGRENAVKTLNHLSTMQHYAKERDFPVLETSAMSAHLKFGTLSVREAYHSIIKKLGAHHPLLRQLYWRDFFTHIAFHNPEVFGNSFHKKYDKLPWNNDKKIFNAWCTGNTGFPIVDAGMRQLNQTGFMHNRVRMIVASFLTKDLHINWLWGEKYFAQQLVDYDPSVNNGNWQWSASTGCDAQPYFRIFNPWLQQKKYDPDCLYIKKWVPELKNQEPSIIHNWFKENSPHIKDYSRPIIDHTKESVLAKMLYKKLSAPK